MGLWSYGWRRRAPAVPPQRVTIRHPWAVAFVFGLLHGVGFASGLAGLGLPRAEVPLALLLFNVGVETGQLAWLGPPNGDPAHAGTIITTRPNEMWGTDATRFYTEENGWCWFFGAIDHYSDDLVGWHVAKRGDRWAALEPIRQGVRQTVGASAKTSRAGSASAATGARSTSPTPGSTR